MCIFFALLRESAIISANMRIKFFFKEAAWAAILAILAYFNIIFWQNAFLGWAILLVFCLYEGKIAHNFLIKYYGLSCALRIFVLSVFLVLAVLGSVGGMLFWLFRLTPSILAVSFLVVGLIFGYIKYITGSVGKSEPEIDDQSKQVLEEPPSAKVGLLLFWVLVIVGFYLLHVSKTTLAISTPWQTISSYYIYIFFGVTLTVGLLIFSKLKSSTLLFLLIVHSFLLHAYLPLTHSLFYGADGWRHIASENSLWLQGDYLKPQLSNQINFWQRIDFGEMAYAQFNALAIFLKTLCQVDLVDYIREFIPKVWPIILPILLFELARLLKLEKKNALFLVWFSSLPFALQASGSFTLPVNFSFLFWLLILLLQLKNQEDFSWPGQIFILFLGGLLAFGHSLYFILFLIVFILLKIIYFLPTRFIYNFFILLMTAVAVPALELVSKFSQFNPNIDWWTAIKSIAGNFSGWYLTAGLRASDITVGNIILNQPPLSALVINIFTHNRFWLVAVMLIFWSIYFFVSLRWVQNSAREKVFLVILTFGLLGGYMISRYFLLGENILARRLDAVLAALVIFPVAHWLYEFILSMNNFYWKRVVVFLIIFIFSTAISTSYSLGPDTITVSGEQYLTMDYIWQREKNSEKICVLSDTYSLLSLEALSAKKFVGGGFPINSFFAQPEREQLLKLSQTDPQSALNEAKKITNLSNCYLVGKYNLPHPLFISDFQNANVYNLNN